MLEVAPTSSVIESVIKSQSMNLDTPSSLKSIKEWIVNTENGSQGGEPGEISRALDSLLGLAL
jgi:L-cysteine:1D-myo-inositol 2-amino-2-deoxy-alpha-D-glucopyranoside ligase